MKAIYKGYNYYDPLFNQSAQYTSSRYIIGALMSLVTIDASRRSPLGPVASISYSYSVGGTWSID